MYTRNYRPPKQTAQTVSDVPSESEKDEGSVCEVPVGYSGTTMLREERAPCEEEQCEEMNAEKSSHHRVFRRAVRFDDARTKTRHYVAESTVTECAPPPTDECDKCEEKCIAPKKHCFSLRDRGFDIEDMLLAGLVLLMLNESADDLTVLMLGFLLISGL